MDYEAILSRKLKSLFPDKGNRDHAKAILGTYGTEKFEREANRVQLAVLKLSGPDLFKLQRNIDSAGQDYRDVLAWAEYPRQSNKWNITDISEKQKLIEADRNEYEKWLNT